MKKISFILLLISSSLCALSQHSKIVGKVSDTSEHQALSQSLITVLRPSDSLLLGFTRTDSTGHFSLSIPAQERILLLINHSGFADYVDYYSLNTATPLNIGNVNLIRKSQLLQEVIVSGTGAIRIKGDTTEYKVDSFHLQAGATVEELLKKLPGIQVDKDGKITAQGETVKKVLIDGEEFFSDDPTVITQNFLSEAVDKVQVYDKKSDQATFTGIDDGKKTKTIDLKLKEDHKKGLFGKAEAGTDFNRYFNNSVMANAFRGKRKIAAYGIMSNTGRTGLDWDDNQTFGGNDNMEMNFEDGNVSVVINGEGDDLDNSNYYGPGLPTGWNGGILYANKWNEERNGLNSSYQYNKLNTDANGYIKSKYILPDTLFYLNESGANHTTKFRHSVKGTYDYKIDSNSTLKIFAQGSTGTTRMFSNSSSESLDENSAIVNRSNRNNTARTDNQLVVSNIIYRKKFKKQGRTISAKFNQRLSDAKGEGFLDASYDYFDRTGAISQSTTTDQEKLRDSRTSNTESRIVYTEPLSKRSILEFNYGLLTSKGHSSITTLQQANPGSGKYEAIVDSLTNNYVLTVLNNSAGINYRFSKPKKISYSFGANIARADFHRQDIKGDSAFRYHFTNFFPRANLNTTLSNGARLSMNYNGNTTAPTVDQLQPIRDNSNELDQHIGNTELKQSFSHQFSGSFEQFKLLANRMVFFYINYTIVNNAFSETNFVDESGKRTWQPVNVQGNHSLEGWLYYSKRLGKSAWNLELNGNVNRRRNSNFLNGLQNINHSTTLNAGPGIRYSKDKKMDFTFSASTGRNWSTSSLRPDQPTTFWTFTPRMDGILYLPVKFSLQTDCSLDFRQTTDAFNNGVNVILWNARLDKKFLAKDKGILRFSAFDLLDQNLNIQRDLNSNFISERQYSRLRRHFLLSIIYNFNNNPNAPQ